MRFSQRILLALGVAATCMTLSVRAQSPAETSPVDPAKAASEAPATTATASATAPVGATAAASPGPATPANPTSAASAPAGAVIPTAATTPAHVAAPTSTATITAAKIPPDVLKRAKDLGLHPETKKGVTRYCKVDTPLGTHFPTKSCYDEDTLPVMLDQIEYQRSLMRRGLGCGGGGGCATP